MGDADRIKYYVQELKANTFNLTRMNLVMRGIKPDNIAARNANTLENDWPMFDEEDPTGMYFPLYADAVVSNPPYSQHLDPTGKETDPRYARFGLAPSSKAYYAFLLHDLFHVKPDGLMTIVLPHGVLFRAGSEAEIRRNLIEQNKSTRLSGCLSTSSSAPASRRSSWCSSSAVAEMTFRSLTPPKGFIKEGKSNQLRACDSERKAYTVGYRQDVDRFASVVSREEVRANDYKPNLPRYVTAIPPAEPVDLRVSVFGGVLEADIDNLSGYWDVMPGLREALFNAKGNDYARASTDDPCQVIDTHPAVAHFRTVVAGVLDGWNGDLKNRLVTGRAAVPLMSTEEALIGEIFVQFAKRWITPVIQTNGVRDCVLPA